MQVAKHKVVTIDYTLTDGKGAVIGTSQGGEPFSYIHGTGSIIPGLEHALEGKSPGDTVAVSIPPEEAYGERDESLMVVIPRDRFEAAGGVEVGMQFETVAETGRRVVTVVKVEGDEVTVDANHPLAGATLNFDVTVVDVRDATSVELSHGHVHGSGTHGD